MIVSLQVILSNIDVLLSQSRKTTVYCLYAGFYVSFWQYPERSTKDVSAAWSLVNKQLCNSLNPFSGFLELFSRIINETHLETSVLLNAFTHIRFWSLERERRPNTKWEYQIRISANLWIQGVELVQYSKTSKYDCVSSFGIPADYISIFVYLNYYVHFPCQFHPAAQTLRYHRKKRMIMQYDRFWQTPEAQRWLKNKT